MLRWEPIITCDPVPPRPRILTPIQEQQAADQVTEWLAKKIIEPVPKAAYCNNLVLVAKKDGRIRVCIDCTPVNRVTKEFDWPLPRLQDLRYRTQGKTWFSRLDLTDAFFRISVPAKFRCYVTFRVKGQAYQFKQMPFGLQTAPSTFQRYMDWGLAEHYNYAYWYIDDILIMAETLKELRQRESAIRETLKGMGSIINDKKSESEKQALLFAGLWVSGNGLGPNKAKLSELLHLPLPKTKEAAQSALGLVSYLRDFLPLISHFTAQLYPDRNGLKLSPHEYEKEWRRLTAHLVSAATTTRHWKEGVDADLYTDASGFGLGAILIQNNRVVSIASRKLTAAETRYSATDREHLGLVFAAQKFRLFLHQSKATTRVWTDHAALTNRHYALLTPRQARWLTIINHWMPKIAHIAGKCNPADFVSRWEIGGLGANL